MLHIPLGLGQIITGTPEQFSRLASYLQERTAAVADPMRLVRLQLWDGQVVLARYAELQAVARALAARAPAPTRARYMPARGAWPAITAVPCAFPAQVDLITQTLNARGTTGGLRHPASGEAQPQDPTSLAVSRSAQPYVAKVCTADTTSGWGWTPSGPLYWTQAGHILVAAVRIVLAHRLLLSADQLLAVRWMRSAAWNCYVPATLLNTWHLHLAGHTATRRLLPPRCSGHPRPDRQDRLWRRHSIGQLRPVIPSAGGRSVKALRDRIAR
jgi:hypothetical protein